MNSGTIIWGLFLVIAGMLLIADNLYLIDFDFGTFWPLILVFFGLIMIIKNAGRNRKTKVVAHESELSS